MSLRATFARGPLGFGAAPLGNMFRDIPDDEAAATVERPGRPVLATSTPPFLCAGLSEIRLGKQLAPHPRDDYVLSTKVGRHDLYAGNHAL